MTLTTDTEQRQLLHASAAKVLAGAADPYGELVALGLVGLGADIPDTTLGDALAVHEEIGRRLATVPYIAENAARLVLARLGLDARGCSLALDPTSFMWTLEPAGALLAFADRTRDVLVARQPPGARHASLEAMPPEQLGARPIATLDLSFPLHELATPSTSSPGQHLASVEPGRLERVIDEARAFSCAALCAEMTGSAEQCLADVVSYLNTRVQFGKTIGSFQALQHKAADMAIRLEGMRAFTAALAAAGFTCSMANPTLQMAKAYISDGYLSIAETSLQLYGGMGFTWEHSAHRRLRHACRTGQMLGAPRALRALHVRELAGGSLP